MNVSEVLNAAADAIELDGWWDGGSCEGAAGLCASSAIAATVRGPALLKVRIAAHQVLWEYLGGDHITAIFNWNDAEERTAAEVVETLRAAALIARLLEGPRATPPTAAPAVVDTAGAVV